MSAFRLSDHGYSRAFTAELVDRIRELEVGAFTVDYLLRYPDHDLVYALTRAANVDVALNRRYRGRASSAARSTVEIARTEVTRFFQRLYRSDASLPTRDGYDSAWVFPVRATDAWRLTRYRPTPTDLEAPLSEEDAERLRSVVVPRPLSDFTEHGLRQLSAAVKRSDYQTVAAALEIDPSRVRDVLPSIASRRAIPIDPADDPSFNPDD